MNECAVEIAIEGSETYLAYPICQTPSGKLNWSHSAKLLAIRLKDARYSAQKRAFSHRKHGPGEPKKC